MGVIVIIAIVAIGVGSYFVLSEETILDFEVNGEVVEVNKTFNIESSDDETILTLSGENFSIPKEFEGNLSYQNGGSTAEFKKEKNYLVIFFEVKVPLNNM